MTVGPEGGNRSLRWPHPLDICSLDAMKALRLLALFDDPTRLDRLALDVAREVRATEDAFVTADAWLAQFKAGFQEV